LGYLLGKKIFGGVIAIISFRPGGSFLSEAREASGSETPRVHHAARRCGRSARAPQPARATELAI
jgi:hypothetical protein